jgi:hypothetical protein
MTIVYGLPRDESVAAASEPAKPIHHDHKQPASNSGDALASENEPCSLRGRIWKSLLGVEDQAIDQQKYRRLVERGASYYDADIRNDTFRCVLPVLLVKISLLMRWTEHFEGTPTSRTACPKTNSSGCSTRSSMSWWESLSRSLVSAEVAA